MSRRARREYSLMEVLELLRIPASRLTNYRMELGDALPPAQRVSRHLIFTAEAVKMLRAFHEKRLQEEAAPFPGLSSDEVSKRLGIPPSIVLGYARRLAPTLQLRKLRGKWVFTEEAVDSIREHHELDRARRAERRMPEKAAFDEIQREMRRVLLGVRQHRSRVDNLGRQATSLWKAMGLLEKRIEILSRKVKSFGSLSKKLVADTPSGGTDDS